MNDKSMPEFNQRVTEIFTLFVANFKELFIGTLATWETDLNKNKTTNRYAHYYFQYGWYMKKH